MSCTGDGIVSFLVVYVSQQEFDAGGVACAADAGSHFSSDQSLVPQVDDVITASSCSALQSVNSLCDQEEEEIGSGRSHQEGADCTFSICTEEREEDETR